MSAKMLPYVPRPTSEAKVRAIERQILPRVWWWRAKRALYFWPYTLAPLAALVLIYETLRGLP